MNWKDILIIIILITVVGGLFAYEYWWGPRKESETLEMPKITKEPVEEKEEAPLLTKEEIPPELIKPEVTCQDECSQTGLKKCSDNSYQICGNYDEDNCLEWGSIINCPANTVCQNGSCISAPIVQCTSGPCCDTLTKTFRPSTYKCQENASTEYGCPWGNEIQGKAGSRINDRYCSGSSSNCDGDLKGGEWIVRNQCTVYEACQNGVCVPACEDGTPYGQCSINKPRHCDLIRFGTKDENYLANKCNICGCPEGQQCQPGGSCIKPNPLVVVTVNSSIQPSIQSSLDQYKTDLEADGYRVSIYPWHQGTPNELRNYLKDQLSNNLVGSLFIGDLPLAWFEKKVTYLEEFPIDLFFMDLDGKWIDTNNNGKYDKHEDGDGDIKPEIWIGRLIPNGFGNQIDLLNNYFRKDHLYRTGQLVLPHRALVYAGPDPALSQPGDDLGLDQIYGDNITIVSYESGNSEDYKDKLKQGYQWVHLITHSSPKCHAFEQPFCSNEIYNIDPKVFFYSITGCSASRYIENEYLGGAYIFSPSYGLAALGDTDVGGFGRPEPFYAFLLGNNTIGYAYKEYIIDAMSDPVHGGDVEIIPLGEKTLLGDPTLRITP